MQQPKRGSHAERRVQFRQSKPAQLFVHGRDRASRRDAAHPSARGPAHRHDRDSVELERAGKSPVIIFEKPGASAMPVVTNVAANRKLLAACLGVEPANIATAFRERCQKYIPCELAKAAAWNEAASEGDEVDASKSPHPHHF